jgi:hypothetical protein
MERNGTNAGEGRQDWEGDQTENSNEKKVNNIGL